MNILEIDLEETGIASSIVTLARSPRWTNSENDLGHMVGIARNLVKMSDPLITNELTSFIRDPDTSAGLAIVKKLPRQPDARRSFLILSETMGNVMRYEDEGDYLIEVKEDPSSTAVRPGFNNSKEFFPHTDLSYVDDPPQYFCLHSLANERTRGGFSEFVDVAELKTLMPNSTIARLREAEFLFPAPTHYRTGGAVKHAILEPSPSNETDFIRFRRDGLRSTTRQGVNAIIELCRLIQETMIEIFLEPDSVAIINNRRVLHGRTAFLGGSSTSTPRHINRLYFEVG